MTINPERRAKTVKARTQRSVLLSTNTKKAPIPLVNQNNNPVHPNANQISLVNKFSCFLVKKFSTSWTSPSQNSITKIPLKKFIATATLSGESQNQLLMGVISPNQKAINICRRKGRLANGPIFPRSIPAFSANTLGIYIYS